MTIGRLSDDVSNGERYLNNIFSLTHLMTTVNKTMKL